MKSALGDFFGSILGRQAQAEKAIHNGDRSARLGMWSRNDPVTLFGAWGGDSRWREVKRTFRWAAPRFSE